MGPLGVRFYCLLFFLIMVQTFLFLWKSQRVFLKTKCLKYYSTATLGFNCFSKGCCVFILFFLLIFSNLSEFKLWHSHSHKKSLLLSAATDVSSQIIFISFFNLPSYELPMCLHILVTCQHTSSQKHFADWSACYLGSILIQLVLKHPITFTF